MADKKLHYFGILTNVDSSILGLKLDNDFEIRKKSIDDVLEILSEIEKSNHRTILDKLISNHINLEIDENNFYCIYNSFTKSEEDDSTQFYNEKIVPKIFYFHTLLRKLRLFKEGNAQFPVDYIYYYDKKEKMNWCGGFGGTYITPEILHIDNSEYPIISSFIKNINLPFSFNFLEFSFKNFELSYQIHDNDSRFLTLMNGIEALFNPGGGELRFRISRSLAVLLGENKNNAERIDVRIKKLYDKRSNIVHKGNANITDQELLELRSYLRKCIIAFHRLNSEKSAILKILNVSGFGESPLKELNNYP